MIDTLLWLEAGFRRTGAFHTLVASPEQHIIVGVVRDTLHDANCRSTAYLLGICFFDAAA